MKLTFAIQKILLPLALLFSLSVEAQLNKYYFYNQARNHIGQEQYTEAIATLNELIKADSKMYEAWFLRGLAKYNLNDLHGSFHDFSQAIIQNPVFSQALLYRGIVLGRLSRFAEAQSDFDMAIDLRPNWADGYYSRGVNYLLSEQPLKSILDFSQVLHFEPKNIDAWVNRGTAHLHGGDTLRALNDYNQAIKLNPAYSEAYGKRGRLYLEMKNHHLALDDLSKAIELDSNSSIHYFLRAITQNTLGNKLNALSDLNKSLDLSPNNALSLYNRALIHWQSGNISNALKDFDKVIRLNPENVLVYYNRGILLYESRSFREAILDFSKAINIFPDFANAYLARSAAYARMGNFNESELDKNFAQSISERYSDQHNQTLTDTTQKLNNLIAFSSDFSPRTTIPILDELDAKPIDILPFIRVILVPTSKLSVRNQLFVPIDTLNHKLKQLDLSLTLGISSSSFFPDGAQTESSFLNNLLLGINLSAEKKYNQAIEAFRNSLYFDQANPLSKINLAAELADMVSFIASFEKDHESINFSNTSQQQRHTTMASSVQLESFSESLEILEQLLITLPDHYAVFYNLGNVYALSNKMETAINFYSKAIETNPYSAEAWYNRGLIHFMQKENQIGCIDMGKAGELGIRQAYLLIHRFCRR